MGTPANLESLRDVGLYFEEASSATAEDIVIAVDTAEGTPPETILAVVRRLLVEPSHSETSRFATFPTTGAAIRNAPQGAVGLVSVPGEHAPRETNLLLDAGHQVMVFSDNIDIDVELELKTNAALTSAAVFGPDCGTALIGGIGLGFVNQTHSGPVSIVAASGTGAQAVAVALDRIGVGVGHIVGLGGRDLCDEIGGATLLAALQALDHDPATEVIVVVAKQIGLLTLGTMMRVVAELSTPIVTCLFGQPDAWVTSLVGAHPANSLCSAATIAKTVLESLPHQRPNVDLAVVDSYRQSLGPDPVVRGLFAGGTLAYEATQILRPLIGDVATDESAASGSHGVVDLGDDRYTRGQPHPMINPSLQADLIRDQLGNGKADIVLFDVVLGHGTHACPAEILAQAVMESRDRPQQFLAIASVVGTVNDPQDLMYQQEILANAGVAVQDETSSAALLAGFVAASEGPQVPIQVVDLSAPPAVINVGASWFAEAVSAQGVNVLHVDWHPPAQGDAELADILDSLT
jgi:FdrA protein